MVLLVLDTQKGITHEGLYAFETFSDNVKTLICEARNADVEVIYVRHDDGTSSGFSAGDEAFEIDDGFAPKDGERIFDKKVNSALHKSAGLLDYLKEKNEKQIMIVGLLTDFCMDATIKSGFDHGFEIVVPEYTNSTFDNRFMTGEVCYRFYNELMWPKRYANCVNMDMAVNMLKKA